MMAGNSFFGFHTSNTALQISNAKSISVPVKLSGEYSKRYFPPFSSISFCNNSAPSTAI